MGQQQLLLLVVGVVLVGLATVAAFAVLERNYKQDEADGLLERGLAIATHASGWRSINLLYGGANGSYERLADNGFAALSIDSTTVRGRYRFTEATANRLVITGVSSRRPEIGIRVFVTEYSVDSSAVSFDGSITF